MRVIVCQRLLTIRYKHTYTQDFDPHFRRPSAKKGRVGFTVKREERRTTVERIHNA